MRMIAFDNEGGTRSYRMNDVPCAAHVRLRLTSFTRVRAIRYRARRNTTHETRAKEDQNAKVTPYVGGTRSHSEERFHHMSDVPCAAHVSRGLTSFTRVRAIGYRARRNAKKRRGTRSTPSP